MSTQITVRLPDDMVAMVDSLVTSGRARSRASVVEQALEHEVRRLLTERDVAILRGAQTPDELAPLAAWAQGQPLDGLDGDER
jgi:Arc/MetJ-type ribon-helix-helix transcriptional regulator